MSLARSFLLLILGGWWAASTLPAAPATFPCYDDEQDVVFLTKEAVINGQDQPGWKMPKFEPAKDHDQGGNLRWVPAPAEVNVEDDLLGYYRGQEVHRLAYSQPDESGHYASADGTKSTLLCVTIGLVTSQPEDRRTRFRPFFLTENGDGLEKVECYFASTKTRPFALLVQESLLGGAHPESDYTFVFRPDGVRLIERKDSGSRRHPRLERVSATITYHYSAAGKLIAVKRHPER